MAKDRVEVDGLFTLDDETALSVGRCEWFRAEPGVHARWYVVEYTDTDDGVKRCLTAHEFGTGRMGALLFKHEAAANAAMLLDSAKHPERLSRYEVVGLRYVRPMFSEKA